MATLLSIELGSYKVAPAEGRDAPAANAASEPQQYAKACNSGQQLWLDGSFLEGNISFLLDLIEERDTYYKTKKQSVIVSRRFIFEPTNGPHSI